jgi:hypothetical protein
MPFRLYRECAGAVFFRLALTTTESPSLYGSENRGGRSVHHPVMRRCWLQSLASAEIAPSFRFIA